MDFQQIFLEHGTGSNSQWRFTLKLFPKRFSQWCYWNEYTLSTWNLADFFYVVHSFFGSEHWFDILSIFQLSLHYVYFIQGLHSCLCIESLWIATKKLNPCGQYIHVERLHRFWSTIYSWTTKDNHAHHCMKLNLGHVLACKVDSVCTKEWKEGTSMVCGASLLHCYYPCQISVLLQQFYSTIGCFRP